MYLPTLTDEELLTYAYQLQDPIIASELEVELAKRLEKRIDAGTDNRLAILNEWNIDTADELMAFLNKVDSFRETVRELSRKVEEL